VPVLPLMKNLHEFGIHNQVNDLLLNKNEVDFRDTIREIVKDYPYTRLQKNENQKSQMNLIRSTHTAS